MAIAETLHRSNTGLVSGLLTAAKRRFEKNRVYRQTYHELSALNDRELADLGIHRSAIRTIALEESK